MPAPDPFAPPSPLDPERQAELDALRALYGTDRLAMLQFGDRMHPRPLDVPKRVAKEDYWYRTQTSFLDPAPGLARPIALRDGRAYVVAQYLTQTVTTAHWDYAYTRLITYAKPKVEVRPQVIVLRDDGRAFGFQGDEPIHALPFEVRLPLRLPLDQQWSPAGLQAYRAGQRPSPRQVFACLAQVFDHFLDLDHPLAPAGSGHPAQLLAAFTLSTWLAPGLNHLPALWLLEDRPGAALPLLNLLARLCCLGTFISGPQSPAALRDLVGCGATLVCDNVLGLDRPGSLPAALRALLLPRAARGAAALVKQFDPESGMWHIHRQTLACPRVLAALGPPSPALAADCLLLPLRSPARPACDPLDPAAWPHPPRALLDDLWALALTHLPAFPACEQRAWREAPPTVPAAWQPLLAVAGWLSDHDLPDLFHLVCRLAQAHPALQRDLLGDDLATLVVRAITSACPHLAGPAASAGSPFVQLSLDLEPPAASATSAASDKDTPPGFTELSTADIIGAALALLDDDSPLNPAHLTPKRVGALLRRLGLPRAPRPPKPPQTRRWRITRRDLERLSLAYGLPFPPSEPAA